MKLGNGDDKYVIDTRDKREIWIRVYSSYFERLYSEAKHNPGLCAIFAITAADLAVKNCEGAINSRVDEE